MDPRIRTKRRAQRTPSPQGPWKHGALPVIGLVGGIGAGKSRVASLLEDHGAVVLDADAIGHTLLTQSPVRERVVARFGRQILEPSPDSHASPCIDRRALGAIVFADPAARRDLEAIVHPRMKKTFERAIARAARLGRARAVVLDAAILFEAGWNVLCDTVIFVEAPRALRLARLAAQRGWNEETLSSRERVQRPLDEKKRLADTIVTNDSPDAERLRNDIDRLWAALFAPARASRAAVARAGSHDQDRKPRRTSRSDSTDPRRDL